MYQRFCLRVKTRGTNNLKVSNWFIYLFYNNRFFFPSAFLTKPAIYFPPFLVPGVNPRFGPTLFNSDSILFHRIMKMGIAD